MQRNRDKYKLNQSGFTLVELLIVVGIIAVLMAITVIAINPGKQFKSVRNAQRSSDVTTILDAIYEYEASNTGNEPTSVSAVTTTAEAIKLKAAVTATNTTFSTPNLTYTVPATNTTTSGSITVTGCANSGNNGVFAVASGTGTTIVVSNTSGVAADTTCSIKAGVDMCSNLAPNYVADMPTDPSTGTVTGGSTPCAAGTTAYNTGYTIAKNSAGNRFTIAAPSAEDGVTISVTR